VASGVVFFAIDGWFDDPVSSPTRSALLFGGLFCLILWSAFSVVRHADCLAVLLGEPLGTIILTIAVIGIEVTMISTVMLTGDANPALGRDTMFSVLMLVLNGLVAMTLLIGGLKHHEPVFNLRGANSYLSVIIPLAILGLVLPQFTTSTSDASASTMLSIFLIVMCVALYVLFLGVQTMRHRHFFTQPSDDDLDVVDTHHPPASMRTVPWHATLLVLTMVPVVLLAKKLAILLDVGVEELGAPTALAGLVVAILVLTPEAVAAARAAADNQMQRSINICLGSAVATIGLTIPAVIIIGFFIGMPVQLGLSRVDSLLLILTLLVSTVTFAGGRTNILQGGVHAVIFMAWIVLIFD
jgi:Ca2+:H+ antiporter